ncbi:glycosyltransferase family 4 protein [Agrobacterium sp.]|uniref:glycosyltransferase family 4 protein n=1 Tax=Agrobacterium sp. TaxID=361 RepID=UPI0028AC1948|nr:glycosyltransferase family 4 protein [Agrobacterium sp.]
MTSLYHDRFADVDRSSGRDVVRADLGGYAGRDAPNVELERIVIIDDYSMARGGATTLSLLSVRLFRQQGIPVTYICGDSGANEELHAIGVEVVALGAQDLLNATKFKAVVNGVYNVAALRLLESWILQNDTPNTAYHVHGWSKILSPAVFKALAAVARRCVVHAHDFFTACPNGAFFDYQAQHICHRKPLGLSCISTACDKRSYSHKLWRVARGSRITNLLTDNRDFGTIVLLHEKMASFLVQAGYEKERLVTIRNPVSVLSKSRIEAENNNEFVFIGRLDEEKGIEDAIAAVEKAGARLCVIGDGPLKGRYSQLNPQIRFVGWQSHEEIGQVIQTASALLMPSRYPEPFGLVAIEAARSGLPVIMSSSAFLVEEMVAAGMALSCDTKNIDVFSDVLQQFNDLAPSQRRIMSERAFQYSQPFALTQEQWRDALVREYCKLVDARIAPSTASYIS